MIQKKEVNKEIVFFYYTEITHQIIDEVLEFIQNVPKSVNGQFTGGLTIIVSSIKFEINNQKPTSLSIGINTMGGVRDIKLVPKKYYYFKKGEIESVENPDDVVLWG